MKETLYCYIGEGKRINKSWLMRLDSKIIQTPKQIGYFTYCLDGQQQDALNLIRDKILETLNELSTQIEAMNQFMSTPSP